MNTILSFRKESIQRSSNASEASSQPPVEFTQGHGPKHARDRWYPTLTTTLTTV
ncbi:MAG TPA: hypothetical protein VGK03_00085 [Geothrix sp.]|jgi:hypothetical protein